MLPMLKTTMKSLFKKPATVVKKPLVRSENIRGHIEFNATDCVYCGLCQKMCPTGAVTVSREEKTWNVNSLSCIVCGYCIEKCNKKSLSMHPELSAPQ